MLVRRSEVTHSVGVSLDGQGRVDRQDLEEEGQLTLEGVLDLGSQAGGGPGDPLTQRGLAHSVVLNLSVTFGVSPHPQLQTGRQRSSGTVESDSHPDKPEPPAVPAPPATISC